MPSPSITITSSDIGSPGALINPIHKGAFCGQGNLSPQFAWVTNGFVSTHILEYRIFILDGTASGSGPSGKFVHWKITGLPNTIPTNVPQNHTFTSGVVASTDYPSGDGPNGYNGPCATSGTDNTYGIVVQAVIKPEYVEFVGAKVRENNEAIVTGTYAFVDNNTNLLAENTTGDCGTLGCPPGSVLIDGQCKTYSTYSVSISSTVYTVGIGTRSYLYGQYGMRMYNNVDGYTFPLADKDTTSLLFDNNGTGSAVATNPAADPLANSIWAAQGTTTKGRLNIAGIFTEVTPEPVNEWIGFSACVDIPTTKQYCIGLASDNQMRFKINGQMIANFKTVGVMNHFRYWHIIPITLTAGANYIEIEGLNEGSSAAFAAEIYDATPAQLIAVTSNAQLDDYIIWTTASRIGETFDIGEVSGYVCPDGTAYDSCNGGQCVGVTYNAPSVVLCCTQIEDCKTGVIKTIRMASGQPDIYLDTVYTFGGHPYFDGKCFKVLGLVLCDTPNYIDVTIVTNHGLDNCTACDPSLKIESCDNPGTYMYIQLADGEENLIEGQIYKFDGMPLSESCYKFIEEVFDHSPDYTVTITTNYGSTNCIVCIPCHIFRACADDEEIIVRFANGATLPEIGFIYKLQGGEVLFYENCFKYIGTTTCVNVGPFVNISIKEDMQCDNCDVCIPKYELTNCADETDTLVISWDDTTPLDENQTYIFDFAPNKCYTAQFQPPQPCGTPPPPPPPPPPATEWRNQACVVGMTDELGFVLFDVDETFDTVHTVESLVINGTEYVTGTPPTYPIPIGGGKAIPANVTMIYANNQFNQTYTDQVTGLNNVFTSLGVDNKIKVQIVTNDIWAGTENTVPGDGLITHGGFYVIVSQTVTSVTMEINDGEGYVRTYSWTFGDGINVVHNTQPRESMRLGYEWASCLNAAEEPIPVVNGVVVEAPFDAPPSP